MFTVKHVTDNGESLFEVDSISLDKTASSTSSTSVIGTLFVHMTDGVTGSFDRGTVYVMNRDGRTVSIYRFDDPHGLQNPTLS